MSSDNWIAILLFLVSVPFLIQSSSIIIDHLFVQRCLEVEVINRNQGVDIYTLQQKGTILFYPLSGRVDVLGKPETTKNSYPESVVPIRRFEANAINKVLVLYKDRYYVPFKIKELFKKQ